jgi:enterochelin esterase-like enzyme
MVFLVGLVSKVSNMMKTTTQPPTAPPQFISAQVLKNFGIIFRIFAPKATSVRLSAGDIPNVPQGGAMTKDEKGVWEVTVPPVPSGAYRYNFTVDGVTTIDPRNAATSESMGNVWSLVTVPGSEMMDTKDVARGAVCAVTYHSKSLSMFRRLHVYTPPGYEKGRGNYPVFYLLHGAGDCDDSWTSVGRAGFIFDNLIAAGKMRPMIVVMPAGHVRPFGAGGALPGVDEFVEDFTKDIMHYIEKNYRTINKREARAIAGLSMGGFQTLNVAVKKLDQFAYIGVYSSGTFGIVPMSRSGAPAAPPPPALAVFPWEENNKAVLDNPSLKKGLKLVWFGIGREDFLLSTSRATVTMLQKHGFTVTSRETEGGHTWLNWRDYLIEFAPQLFR